MKVSRQRNPYLKRIYSQTPHKYSFDMQSGKYFLLDQQGGNTRINSNGTFRPHFRPNYSGFVNHQTRYVDSSNDPSVLHFAPDPNPQTQYHNPVQDKFAGYAQFPYQLKKDLPVYLKKPGQTPKYPRKKAQSLILSKQPKVEQQARAKNQSNKSAILQYSTFNWTKDPQTKYFNSAWNAMSTTKPLPKQKKKTCYNYKCKFMKQWVFDERSKLEQAKVNRSQGSTLGRSFHEGALTQELQQSKLISTMALSGIA